MRKYVTTAVIIAAIALYAILTGCSYGARTPAKTGSTPADANTVVERNLAFEPATLNVAVGDTVTFTNEDSATHDVEIDGVNLGQHGQGESVTWKAERAGTFPYRCTIHPSMTGEIVVE